MLSDIVEVTDPKWQGAVEGVLGGYASVVLLEKAKDAPAAYRLAEKERYRHFIVPDCVHAPVTKDDSLLSVVRFSQDAPSWLIDQLARIDRVESVEAGFKTKSEEWITPDAYHRERRGGRSLEEQLARLSPADLTLLEGFKQYPIDKLEVYRRDQGRAPLYPAAAGNRQQSRYAWTCPRHRCLRR